MTTHLPTSLPNAARGGVSAVGTWMPAPARPRIVALRRRVVRHAPGVAPH